MVAVVLKDSVVFKRSTATIYEAQYCANAKVNIFGIATVLAVAYTHFWLSCSSSDCVYMQFSTAAVHAAEERQKAASKETSWQPLLLSQGLSSSYTPTISIENTCHLKACLLRVYALCVIRAVCDPGRPLM